MHSRSARAGTRSRCWSASALVGLGGLYALYEAGEHGGELVYSYAGGVGIRTGAPEDVGRLLLAGLYHQAQLDRKAQRPEDAAVLIELAARRFPSDPGVQLAAAESLLLDRKDAAAAVAALERTSVPPDDRRLRTRRAFLLADAFESQGNKAGALAALEPLAAEFPQNERLKKRIDSSAAAARAELARGRRALDWAASRVRRPASHEAAHLQAHRDPLEEGPRRRRAARRDRLRPHEAGRRRSSRASVARQLGVGQPVIREALLDLEHQGFVQRVPYRGTSVTKLGPEEIEQIQQHARRARGARDRAGARPRDARGREGAARHSWRAWRKSAEAGTSRSSTTATWRCTARSGSCPGNKYLADALERAVVPMLTFFYLSSGQIGELHAQSVASHAALVEAVAAPTPRRIASARPSETLRDQSLGARRTPPLVARTPLIRNVVGVDPSGRIRASGARIARITHCNQRIEPVASAGRSPARRLH